MDSADSKSAERIASKEVNLNRMYSSDSKRSAAQARWLLMRPRQLPILSWASRYSPITSRHRERFAYSFIWMASPCIVTSVPHS